MEGLRSELDRHIYAIFPTAIALAKEKAGETSNRWNTMHWNTYKATCRWRGEFKYHDWNQELSHPILLSIASGWETAFSNTVPEVLEGLATEAKKQLNIFQDETKGAIGEVLLAQDAATLQSQLSNYEAVLRDMCKSTTVSIHASQKQINRQFNSVVADMMNAGYQTCRRKRGQCISSSWGALWKKTNDI
jgi:hypothetical protein